MMAEKSTFIKLDRNILKWRWYKNSNTMRLFVHLLITANVATHDFEGITIHRGQTATSYPSLANSLKMTIQEVRTALGHLKSTGEVTVKRYPKYTVVTILNYNAYQKTTAKSTHNQQSSNSQATVNQQQLKNIKNEKNNKEIKNSRVKIPDGFSSAAEFERHVAELRR